MRRAHVPAGGQGSGHVTARLLHDPDLPVKVVAERVGYRQPAQFAKSFRVRYGATPRDFRRMHRDGAARQDAANPR